MGSTGTCESTIVVRILTSEAFRKIWIPRNWAGHSAMEAVDTSQNPLSGVFPGRGVTLLTWVWPESHRITFGKE